MSKNSAELTAEGKLGIIGTQQSAQFLGASVEIHSDTGKGTTVKLEGSLE